MEGPWLYHWHPGLRLCQYVGDPSLRTVIGQRKGQCMMTTGKDGVLLSADPRSISVGTWRLRVQGHLDVPENANAKISLLCGESADVILWQSALPSFVGHWQPQEHIVLTQNVQNMTFRLEVDHAVIGGVIGYVLERTDIAPRS